MEAEDGWTGTVGGDAGILGSDRLEEARPPLRLLRPDAAPLLPLKPPLPAVSSFQLFSGCGAEACCCGWPVLRLLAVLLAVAELLARRLLLAAGRWRFQALPGGDADCAASSPSASADAFVYPSNKGFLRVPRSGCSIEPRRPAAWSDSSAREWSLPLPVCVLLCDLATISASSIAEPEDLPLRKLSGEEVITPTPCIAPCSSSRVRRPRGGLSGVSSGGGNEGNACNRPSAEVEKARELIGILLRAPGWTR